MNEEPLCYMSFKPDNQVPYGQGFQFSCGIPTGIRFTVYRFYRFAGTYKLMGPGYGACSDYGNGALYVCLGPVDPYV